MLAEDDAEADLTSGLDAALEIVDDLEDRYEHYTEDFPVHARTPSKIGRGDANAVNGGYTKIMGIRERARNGALKRFTAGPRAG